NTDVVCRMGGEEFLVFFPEPEDNPNVEAACQRLIERLNSEPFQFENLRFYVTASMGGLAVSTNEPTTNAITFSDKLLYEAKRSARNQAVVACIRDSLPNVNLVGPPCKTQFDLCVIKPDKDCRKQH
ncbi:diguanylate cyclase, partial [Vibrio rotiferianus]